MLNILLLFILIRPFISSIAFPLENNIYSFLLASFLIIYNFIHKPRVNKLGSIKYPLILFVLSLIISFIFSVSKSNSFPRLYDYLTGVLLFITMFSISNKNKVQVIRIIILSGMIVSFMAIHQYLFGFQHLSEYIAEKGITNSFIIDCVNQKRAFFPFVTPNILAGFLAMVIFLIPAVNHKWDCCETRQKCHCERPKGARQSIAPTTRKDCFVTSFLAMTHKWHFATVPKYKSIIFLTMFSALFFTKSLGGILTFFIAATIYFYLKKSLFTWKGFFLTFVLIITAVFIFSLRIENIKQNFLPGFSLIKRMEYWRQTINIIKLYPFAGIGMGNLNLPMSRYAHNLYLQFWAETGIIGLIPFIWVIGSILLLKLKSISFCHSERSEESIHYSAILIALFAGSIAFLIDNFVSFSFFLPEVSFIWWVILGILASF